MALGTTLAELVAALRAEIGASPSPSQGVNALAGYQQLIRRTQDRLHNDVAWSHLIIDADEALLPGERYYSFQPTLDYLRITSVRRKFGATWQTVFEGIVPQYYNLIDSDAGVRSDPVQRWRHYLTGQYEVWPIPSTAQTLRFRGVGRLRALVADTDTADLDDTLIVLFAAARKLRDLKSESADSVLAEANSHLNRLKAHNSKGSPFILGGGLPARHSPRTIDYAPNS